MVIHSLKLIIISDLHCHFGGNGDDATYLTSDMLRVPTDSHPVESLLSIIEKEKGFSTDYTICPGDFTNKSDKQGFISGWNYVQEINEALGGKEIIATVGNHDVDSYEKITDYNLEIAKGIKKDFPLAKEEDRNTFWGKGCVFLERENCRILVINSSHFHYNKVNAAKGKVDYNLIDYVNEYLGNVTDNKIQIALSHHHPIDHSRLNLGEEDKIVNGSELLDVLCKYKFDLFIHGHKHDALLRNYTLSPTPHVLPILSAGSFSAKTNISFTSMRNQFHELEIVKNLNGESGPAKGSIKTWTFFSRQGWKLSNDDEAFPPRTGFGFNGNIKDLADGIEKLLASEDMLKWADILNKIPDVKYLVPTEWLSLEEELDDRGLAVHRNKKTKHIDCIFKNRF